MLNVNGSRRMQACGASILVLLAGCGGNTTGMYRPPRIDVAAQLADRGLSQQAVWIAGEGGYHTYRIPALIVAANGDLLAFCEGRKDSAADSGNIDLLLKRSHDGGETWMPTQVLLDAGPDTAGNPCPVVDASTGRIWLPLTRNPGPDKESAILAKSATGSRTVWIMYSDDHGATWSPVREVTAEVKRPDWTWFATGPGVGIQLHTGRLLIPCDYAPAGRKSHGSHAIYSDDHGRTWHIGGILPDRVNECQAVELSDGTVMMNMRSYHGLHARAVALSHDGGLTWDALTHDQTLIEPTCQASLVRLGYVVDRHPDCLLFSNPASEKRRSMTVRLSEDGGKSWAFAGVLFAGPAAYSSLTVLPAGRIACLYERGNKNPYEEITLARFGLGWLTQSRASRLATATQTESRD